MESPDEPEGELEEEPLGALEGELEGSLFMREDSPEGLLMESPEEGLLMESPDVDFFFIASPVFFFFSAGFVVGSAWVRASGFAKAPAMGTRVIAANATAIRDLDMRWFLNASEFINFLRDPPPR